MASLVDLPKHLRKWEDVFSDLARSEDDETLLYYEQMVADGIRLPQQKQRLRRSEFEELIDLCRCLVPFPMRPKKPEPPLRIALRADACVSDLDQSYTWSWLQLPIQWLSPAGNSLDTFPLPVAKLYRCHVGCFHLLSLTALWHLMPMQTACAKFFQDNASNQDLWDFARHMFVPKNSFIGSIRRATLKHKDRPTTGLQFSSHMATIKFLLVVFVRLMAPAHQKTETITACRSLLEALINVLPDSVVFGWGFKGDQLIETTVNCRLVSCEFAAGFADYLGLLDDFNHYMDERKLTLAANVEVPLVVMVEFIFRRYNSSSVVFRCCRWIVRSLGALCEAHISASLSNTIPSCTMPSDMANVRRAMRSADKQWLASQSWLGNYTGLAKQELDLVFGKLCKTESSLAEWKRAQVRVLVAAYFEKARRLLRARASASTKMVSSDMVMFDASRVSCRELFQVVLLSEGMLVEAPLQILPDSTATLDHELAMTNANQALAPDPGSKLAKAKAAMRPGATTRSYVIAMAHSMFTVLPVERLSAYLPSGRDIPTSDCTRCDHPGGVPYNHFTGDVRGGDDARKPCWVLPTELHVRHHAPGMVRLLVLVGDEGSPGWKLFMFFANKLGLRVIFFRDAPHRLSNLFCNTLRKLCFRHILNAAPPPMSVCVMCGRYELCSACVLARVRTHCYTHVLADSAACSSLRLRICSDTY